MAVGASLVGAVSAAPVSTGHEVSVPGARTVILGWAPTELISTGSVDEDANPNRPPALIRVRANGSAAAAWHTGGDSSWEHLKVATRSSTGAWSAPHNLAKVRYSNEFDLAVGRGGLASVVWQERVSGRLRVVESHRASGGWSRPVPLGVGMASGTTIDGRGVTTVAWSGPSGLHVVRRPAGKNWQKPVRVGARSDRAWRLAIDSNADGDVVLGWLVGRKVRGAVRSQRGTWAHARTLDRTNVVWNIAMAVGPNGRGLMLWPTYAYGYLGWARSKPDGRWCGKRVLTDRLGEDGGDMSLSMNGSGLAVVAWLRVDHSSSPAFTWSARFRPRHGWTSPVRVSKRSSGWGLPFAWLAKRDMAHVVTGRGDTSEILAFGQRPGAAWGPGRKVAGGDALDVDGRGARMALLYVGRQGLQARLLTTRH